MTTAKTKRKLLALVHADVKGYSRMMPEKMTLIVVLLCEPRIYTARAIKTNPAYALESHGGEK